MRRPAWVTLAAVAVVVILAVAVAAYLAGRNSSPTPSAASTRTTLAAPTVSASTSADTLAAAPTGCLGGAARDDTMVLAAQRQAPHTAYGAIEFAASVFRWGVRAPAPTDSEVRAAAAVFASGVREAAVQETLSNYHQHPNLSEGAVPDGTPFHLTTASGRWLTEPSSSTDHATVEVEAYFVINGAVSPTKSLTEAFDVVWETGGWHVASLKQADPQRLANGGTQFTGGC